MYEFTDRQIEEWLDSWAQYRDENDGVIRQPTPERDGMEFYLFYLCSITYAAIPLDETAMNTLDSVLDEMDSQDIRDIDNYLVSFHDYLIIMGVVDG